MWNLLKQYYGLDWVGMITSILFLYFMGNKKRIGFIWGIIANITWIMLNFWAHIFAGVILNVILFILNVRGFIKWGSKK